MLVDVPLLMVEVVVVPHPEPLVVIERDPETMLPEIPAFIVTTYVVFALKLVALTTSIGNGFGLLRAVDPEVYDPDATVEPSLVTVHLWINPPGVGIGNRVADM